MSVGKCRHCGHEPVAFDAKICPKCGGRGPNPNVVSRYAGKGIVVGIIGGGVLGGTWGFFSLSGGGVVSAVIGFMFGGIAGFVVGWLGGIVAGLAAWAMGK